MPFLVDFGKIERISIPDDWAEAPNLDSSAEIVIYELLEARDVKLSFFYRSKPLSQRTAQNLTKILALPAHTLDSQECLSIETVLRDAAEEEYFDKKSLRTELLNGQSILIAEGFWKLSNVESFAVFILSNENDEPRIDEIYYVAPGELFGKYLPLFIKILNTIKWVADLS